MKFTFLFFCLMQDFFGSSQIFLSFGVNQQTETLDNIQDHFKFKKKQMTHTNNVFFLKGNYIIKNHFAAQIELFSFSKENVSGYYRVTTTTGGGSSPIWQTRKTYYANVNYNYKGFKLGASYFNEGQSLLFKKASSTIQIGAFVQADFLSGYRESNHSTHKVVSNNSNMGQTMVVSEDSYSYAPFKAMNARESLISIALQFNKRLIYKNVFLELNLALGFMGDYRITNAPPNANQTNKEEGKKFFASSGLGIG